MTNGYFPTELADDSPGPKEGLEDSMSKLQREMTNRSQRLLEAEDEEDRAREVRVTSQDLYCLCCMNCAVLILNAEHLYYADIWYMKTII